MCAVRKTKMKLGVAAVLKELAKEKKKKDCHYTHENALIAVMKEQKTSGEVKIAFYWERKKPRKTSWKRQHLN